MATAVAIADGVSAANADALPAPNYAREVEPLLDMYCYDCHGNGVHKGRVALDEFTSEQDLHDRHGLWLKVLKNVRAGLMPAEGEPKPTAAELAILERWIKTQVFKIDPEQPDPGHVTVRRLNRVDYRETIRELMGVDYDSEAEFPADDTGHGFDNLGEVLSSSPLLFEKYLQAAATVVDKAVPRQPRVPRQVTAPPRSFMRSDGVRNTLIKGHTGGETTTVFTVKEAGEYRLELEAGVSRSFDFDPGSSLATIRVNGERVMEREIRWGSRSVRFDRTLELPSGQLELTLALEPQMGGDDLEATFFDIRVNAARLTGPLAADRWEPAENYARFFPHGEPPADAAGRDAYVREALRAFVTRAYRRPVADATVDHLVTLARSVYTQAGQRVEDGFARAAMAVLASPSFIFRLEEPLAADRAQPFPRIDEFALASRLSYLLWSSMPDRELFELAEKGALREQLPAQVSRMIADPKSKAFVRNFVGQWLQARDIETVSINTRVILRDPQLQFEELRKAFDGPMRRLLRSETETYFGHVLREDRSLLELIDSNYTFLNARLAAYYGLPPIEGDELRKVELAPDSVRGGILTQGTVLAVTSNPTRTSLVKRGLFVLENILGQPPPPPPVDIPPLEESVRKGGGTVSLREVLAEHRSSPQCSSCHTRMDPIGFALENFDAMGRWRGTEDGLPIDASGQLATGESFVDIRDLKRLLVNERRRDTYQGITEKFLIYALGRGIDYRDVPTVDSIVDALETSGGKISTLVMGVVQSAPFQRMRRDSLPESETTARPVGTAVTSSTPASSPSFP